MAKRPQLSELSFLGHLFSPKKHTAPTGIRKTTLKGKTGQKRGRIAAFNRMAPFKQELLKRSGTRDSYLRGETTLADAKTVLRPQGLAHGVARPLRQRAKMPPAGRMTPLDVRVLSYTTTKLREHGRQVNLRTVNAQLPFFGDNADEQMLRWDIGEIKHAGRQGSEYEVVVDGVTHNPFWYH